MLTTFSHNSVDQWLFTDAFPIELNTNVTSVTVPADTPASWAIFVAAVCAPTMNPISESLRSLLAILIKHLNQLGLLYLPQSMIGR